MLKDCKLAQKNQSFRQNLANTSTACHSNKYPFTKPEFNTPQKMHQNNKLYHTRTKKTTKKKSHTKNSINPIKMQINNVLHLINEGHYQQNLI